MEIIKYMGYVNRSRVDHEIATVQPFKVNVDRCWGADITPLMDSIERSFRVYQYKKDNGVKFGEHELFYWTNTNPNCLRADGKLSFFSLNLNDRTPTDERHAVLDRLLEILKQWDGSVVGEKSEILKLSDGTCRKIDHSPSKASVCYHDELIDSDALHIKALERMNFIGNRKCKCGGLVGRFRHDCFGTLFQKHRTRKFYKITDEAAACTELV